MSLKKFDSYVKVQEFLEDIYMFLNNNALTQSPDDIERQKSKRKELIENCKHIRSIFEAEFHPHDDDEVDSSSYLDMNRAGMNRNQQRQESTVECVEVNENHKEEYINMNQRSPQQENTYDMYETSPIMENQDANKCPYTGLPAAHLKIMNSLQFGLLTRIEKKLFFAQTKDFYAGILEKWILLYHSKSNDMRPSECFFPKSIESEKGENQFSVVTNSGKRFHFQAPNNEEYQQWITNIKKILEDSENIQLRERQSSQLSFRKLPSPPLDDQEEIQDSGSSSENYYGFNRSSNQTVINTDERLYEEPTRRSKESPENDQHNDQPPILPAKLGKKNRKISAHSYDIPKSTKIIIESDKSERSSCYEPSTSQDEPTSSSSDKTASPSPEPTNTPTSEKSRKKVSEMTAILSSINLVSPEERKSAYASKVKKIPTSDKNEGEQRISPMKSWFTKQINKRKSKREKTPDVVEEVENEEPSVGIKGSKVNMIINQLEKNGQLKVLSKSLKNRKSGAYNEGDEYETVCVRN